MVGIYKVTNTINDKVYIGQSKNISQRWRVHRYRAFSKSAEDYEKPLYRAIRKWCKTENLPSKSSDIKKYSDEEWERI